MRIAPAKNPNATPRTRKELLYHLWGVGIGDANVFREGAIYAATTGGKIYATHCRMIGNWSFAQWETKFREGYFGV